MDDKKPRTGVGQGQGQHLQLHNTSNFARPSLKVEAKRKKYTIRSTGPYCSSVAGNNIDATTT